jgi:cytochrome c556
VKNNLVLFVSIFFVCGATVSSAQQDVLSGTAIMRDMAQPMYRVLNRMVKGELPYDQSKADEALTAIVALTPKIPSAFPASNKGKVTPDSRYAASPKVWETRADFEEYAANLSKAISDNRSKVKSLAGLKDAFKEINDACNGCHSDYRTRQR